MRVLVVEDELLIALSLCEYLREMELKPLQPVSSGNRAVEIALKEKPDLILMDIRISGRINGIEAAQKIREHLQVPIIFMTGYATEDFKEQALSIKFTAFVEKPISLDRLKSIVDGYKNQ